MGAGKKHCKGKDDTDFNHYKWWFNADLMVI